MLVPFQMRYLATVLISLMLALPAMSVELFRYLGAAKHGGSMNDGVEGFRTQLQKELRESAKKSGVGRSTSLEKWLKQSPSNA
jgi:hypothetical protein